ncbi:type IV pilus modification PilV family protein [Lysinibacillus sp. 54212]|uniref:type IV pilus modification PilV family protein n=1 Tax=Lysinibacillus sp. 54212 TaxID=3119829 RepID=UPI002FC6BA51
MKTIKNERGFGLLEVVASIVLITIILLSFFAFFIQSKKTNSSSESINEATYIAQKEMEKIYNLSKQSSLSNLSRSYINGYTFLEEEINNCTNSSTIDPSTYGKIFSYQKDIDNFTSKITISTLCDYENAGNVLIEVSDSSDIQKAKVENIYVWK